MKKRLLVILMAMIAMFLVSCQTGDHVAMPKVSGQEISMTSQELNELLNETDYDGFSRLTTIIYLDMDMEINISSGAQTSQTAMKMNISGKQGISGIQSSLELIADMKMDMNFKTTVDDENYLNADIDGAIGFYYTESTAYANLDVELKGTTMGQNNNQTFKSKTYSIVPFDQIYEEFASAAGISDQTEASTSFAEIIDINASTSFKVYEDGNRYSIVYEFDQSQLLNQLEMADLVDSGISFGNLDASKGEFIVIIEENKVVDAGINVNINLDLTVNQLGASGSGKIKFVLQTRYLTTEADYPSLPNDLDSYTLDESSNFGFPDLI